MTDKVTGRCRCGAVRYACAEDYSHAVHRHCSACRRSSGAAFMTWVCLPRAAFKLAGAVVQRQSSAGVTRSFCASCGAQILMDYSGSDTVDVSIGTLDAPEGITVRDNIFVEERLPLAKGFDSDLPQHKRFRTDSRS